MIAESVLCLALAVYHEARSEPILGQIAVAEVVMNRTEDPNFPNTVCEVVKQQSQFAPAAKNEVSMKEEEAKALALAIATIVFNNQERILSDNPTYFHTKDVSPTWSKRFHKVEEIGSHIFYKS